MPTLQKIPGKLTIGEFSRRFKENPDDPVIQEYREEIRRIVVNLTPSLTEFISFANQATKEINSGIVNAILLSNSFKSSIQSAKIYVEIISSELQQIKKFRFPTELFDNLKHISFEIKKFSEPIRLLAQTFSTYRTPHLLNPLTSFDIHWINDNYSPNVTITSEHDYRETLKNEVRLFEEELDNLNKIEPEVMEKPYYYYKATKTFLIKITTLAAITLYTKSGKSDIEIFFESILELLEERGQLVKEFRKVFIPVTDLIQKLINKGVKEPTMDWIKNTRSNIVNHKIPAFLKDDISISEYDKGSGGYYFQIRVTTYLPKFS